MVSRHGIRKPVRQGFMTVPMLRDRAKKAEIMATRAHIENAIARGEIKGTASDLSHQSHRTIFPVSEGEKFLRNFAKRSPQKGFVTVPEAIRIIKSRGQKLTRSGLEKIIDRGLRSGGRLSVAPKHGRFLSRSVLEQIIQNLAAGREPAAGLISSARDKKPIRKKTRAPKRPAPKPGPVPKAKKPESVPAAPKAQEPLPIKKPVPQDPKKDAAKRRKENKEMARKWLEQHASEVKMTESTRQYIQKIINQWADLPPEKFHEKTITIIRKQLGI